MTILPPNAKTFSSRDFNQNTGEAKKAADEGPVFITDRGEPRHVLMSIEQYQQLVQKPMTLAEALEHPDSADIELDIAPRKINPRRPLDLS
jgi:prevent-host-death family protein